MVVARLAVALTVLLALSGCFVSEDDVQGAVDQAATELENHGYNGSAVRQAASVVRAIENVSANVTGLNLTLVFTADGNGTLAYGVAFGDNSSANGTMLRAMEVDESVRPTGNYSFLANLTHAYNGTGVYNLTVTVTAGGASLSRSLNVTIGEPAPTFGPTQDPIQLTGSVLCAPTAVLPGEIAGDSQVFTVNDAQRAFTLTLAYDELLVEDLDFILTSPSGEEFASEAAGPEPPLDVDAPEAGEWTLVIIGYSCMGELSYTADILFA